METKWSKATGTMRTATPVACSMMYVTKCPHSQCLTRLQANDETYDPAGEEYNTDDEFASGDYDFGLPEDSDLSSDEKAPRSLLSGQGEVLNEEDWTVKVTEDGIGRTRQEKRCRKNMSMFDRLHEHARVKKDSILERYVSKHSINIQNSCSTNLDPSYTTRADSVSLRPSV